jgi:hypothetical protein
MPPLRQCTKIVQYRHHLALLEGGHVAAALCPPAIEGFQVEAALGPVATKCGHVAASLGPPAILVGGQVAAALGPALILEGGHGQVVQLLALLLYIREWPDCCSSWPYC